MLALGLSCLRSAPLTPGELSRSRAAASARRGDWRSVRPFVAGGYRELTSERRCLPRFSKHQRARSRSRRSIESLNLQRTTSPSASGRDENQPSRQALSSRVMPGFRTQVENVGSQFVSLRQLILRYVLGRLAGESFVMGIASRSTLPGRAGGGTSAFTNRT